MTTQIRTVRQVWHFSPPPEDSRHAPMQLLTIAGIGVQGEWCGQMGEHYSAWAPLTQGNVEAYQRSFN